MPFTGNGETEQRARGERLAHFRLAEILDDRSLTPHVLAQAVDRAAARTQWGTWDFDSDGAARTAEIVTELVAARRARRPSHAGISH